MRRLHYHLVDVFTDRAFGGNPLAVFTNGRGLATEGSRALLDHAFLTLVLPFVWAGTMAVNAGSRGVMEKLGMRHVSTAVEHWDHPLPGAGLGEVRYEITREEWLALTPSARPRRPEGGTSARTASSTRPREP